jgi:hypothetical protein
MAAAVTFLQCNPLGARTLVGCLVVPAATQCTMLVCFSLN